MQKPFLKIRIKKFHTFYINRATGKKISPKTGNAYGRPARKFPKGWEVSYNNWKGSKETAIATME